MLVELMLFCCVDPRCWFVVFAAAVVIVVVVVTVVQWVVVFVEH